jgi:hypothetical protein
MHRKCLKPSSGCNTSLAGMSGKKISDSYTIVPQYKTLYQTNSVSYFDPAGGIKQLLCKL